MTKSEFSQQMKRMNEAYKGYYTTERLKAIWSIVANIDSKTFAKKIDKALWADYAPKLDWFQSITSSTKANETFRSPDFRDPEKYTLQELTDFLDRLKK